MILPNGALVAVVDGEKLVMFKNIGHEALELSALPPPAIDATGPGQHGHQSSAARRRLSSAVGLALAFAVGNQFSISA